MVLTDTQQAFFALVQAGLWEQDVRLASFEEIDYSEVLRLAEEQTVMGLVTAGLEHVADINVSKEVLIEFIGYTLQIEQHCKAMDQYASGLIQKLRNNGVYALLMKGQGIAQCYERPNWRSCGDVDLLLSKDNYENAKRLLIPIATSVDDEEEKRKHLALTFGNWEVELHGTLRTNLWSSIERLMDEIQKDVLYSGHVRSWMDGKTQIFLLRADEDVIYVFAHILQHFFIEGIGLRQICDWCRLLYTYGDSIDKNLLEKRLMSANLMTKWKAFAAFAVDFLGMPTNVMPFYDHSASFKKMAINIADLVLDSGNFGQSKDKSYKVKHTKMISYCISFCKHAKDGYRRFRLFPTEAILMWWKLMIHGLKNMLCLSDNPASLV